MCPAMPRSPIMAALEWAEGEEGSLEAATFHVCNSSLKHFAVRHSESSSSSSSCCCSILVSPHFISSACRLRPGLGARIPTYSNRIASPAVARAEADLPYHSSADWILLFVTLSAVNRAVVIEESAAAAAAAAPLTELDCEGQRTCGRVSEMENLHFHQSHPKQRSV